jgi:carboxypeptidase family protein
MVSTRFARAACVAALGVLLFPGVSFAQSAIAGVVTDTTGAVLPGVTVEAASPALIEKVRTAISDGSGRYRIEDLRPGTYKVTFTLPGFGTSVRDGFVLEADFTATMNAQLRVGTLAETVTVSGAAPVVDVQSTASRTVLTKEQVDALPTGRSYQSIAATIPALSAQLAGRFDVGGGTQMWQGTVVAYGGLSADFAVQIDGMNISSLLRTGDITGLYHNQSSFQDMVYQVVAGSAESQSGGVTVNMIPKEGGNRFSGEALATYSNEHLRSENNDANLRSRGLTVPPNLYDLKDFNFSLGGPILKNRLWFFFSPRFWGASNYLLNGILPDGSQAIDHTRLKAYTTRITAQIGQKHKVTALWNPEKKLRDYLGGESGTGSPEGWSPQDAFIRGIQAKWTSTLSNKLLVEAGYSQLYAYGPFARQPSVKGPSATNPWGDIPKSDTGITSRTFFNSWYYTGPLESTADTVVGSVSYITGSHSVKVGIQDRMGNWINDYDNTHGYVVQLYDKGVPVGVRVQNYPVNRRSDLNGDLSIYAQDSWKRGRLTFNPGLRFEHFNGEVPEQSAPAGRWVDERHFARIPDLPNFNTWLIRLGAAYDLFGDGKTALKASVGRYTNQGATNFQELYNPMIETPADVDWTDLNHDDIADGTRGCVYLTPGCEINLAQIPTTFGVRRNRNPDPNIKRTTQMVYNLALTREVRPGLGVSVGYYHRKYYDIPYTQDLAKPLSVYTPYEIPDPRDNGQSITIYSIDPAALRTIDELDTTSKNNSAAFHSVDVTINARLANGAFLQGGTATGRIWNATCDINNPNSGPIGVLASQGSLLQTGLRFCDQRQFDIPWRTTFKLSGAYPLPYGLRLSAVFQSSAGDPLAYSYFVSRATFQKFTGVALGQSSVTVYPLNEPGSQYYDRVNQLDFTIAKVFKVRNWRVTPDVGLFNMLNANPITSASIGYPEVGNPLRILESRLIRFGIQATF